MFFWKLQNLETRVNFQIVFTMFEKSNRKKIGTARKDLGTSLEPQCYAMQVAGHVRDDNRRQLRRQSLSFPLFTLFLLDKIVCSKWLRIRIDITLPLPPKME